MSFSLKKYKRRYKSRNWINTRISKWYRIKSSYWAMISSGLTAQSIARINMIQATKMDKLEKASTIAKEIVGCHAAIQKARIRAMQ